MPHGTIRVMVIEDDPNVMDLLSLRLNDGNKGRFEVEHFDHLESGLTRLKSHAVDVMLLDLSLPDSQGLATLAKVTSIAPAFPIIVLADADFTREILEATRTPGPT